MRATRVIGSGILLLVTLVGATGIVAGLDRFAQQLVLAGLVAFSIGWIALGWTW